MFFQNYSIGEPTKGPDWPTDEKGKPLAAHFVGHMREVDMEGQIVINLLTSAGIPVKLKYPNDGSFGRVILGFSGTGVEIYVPEIMLEEAKGLLEGEIIEEEAQDV